MSHEPVGGTQGVSARALSPATPARAGTTGAQAASRRPAGDADAACAREQALRFEHALQRAARGAEPRTDDRHEPPPLGAGAAAAAQAGAAARTPALDVPMPAAPAAAPAVATAHTLAARWAALPDAAPVRELKVELPERGTPLRAVELHANAPGVVQLALQTAAGITLGAPLLARLRARLQQHGREVDVVERPADDEREPRR